MVVAENGTKGARNPDITTKILQLRKKDHPIEKPDTRFSGMGVVSDGIYNILTLLLGNGYIQQLSPAQITPKGRAFLKETIQRYLDDAQTREACTGLLKEINLREL